MEKEKKLEEKVFSIVGFGAIVENGRELNSQEVEAIASYCKTFGADSEYIEKVLENRGRPYSLSDPTFKRSCGICTAPVNYCCC